METTPDLSSSGQSSSSRRRRIALLIGGGVIIAGGFVAVALAANGGGGSSSSNASAKVPAGNGAHDGNGAGNPSSTAGRPLGSPGSTGAPGFTGPGSSTGPGASSPRGSTPKGSSPASGSGPTTTLPKYHGLTPGHYGTKPVAPPKAPPAVEQAYVTAFRAECESIWSIATSDGRLWDPDADPPRTPYTINDCLKQLSPAQADYAFDESDASASGTSDAMDAASGLTWFGTLQNTPGTQKWVDPNWSQ
jgi:hypothetical protein